MAPAPPEPASTATPDNPRQLGDRRTYRGPGRSVNMPNATSVRDAARAGGGVVPVPVTVTLDDAEVSGQVGVLHRGGLRYEVGEIVDDPLVCNRHGTGCDHVDQAIESSRAVLEARHIRAGLADMAQATQTTSAALAVDHAASETARAAAIADRHDGTSWTDDPAAFQDAYNQARQRRRQGEPPVPYLTENATDGLGARHGGRPFGVEIEFDIDPAVNRTQALQAIADDLHTQGIIAQPRQTGYHSSNNYSRWRFEHDATVHGEIISPIMHDETQSWAQLQTVCDIVRRHGGQATARTGGHVHVGVADYDHTVENHRRLLATYRENEDTLFRLAQNPGRDAHRGVHWCAPNRDHEANYGPAADVSNFAARHSGHNLAMNFGGAGTGGPTSHVEYRMWDSSLDPAVIQTHIKTSLAMTQAAFAARQPSGPPTPVGTHRAANAHLPRGTRLRGQEWQNDTHGFRTMIDRLFHRDIDKAQATALFAVTKWQKPR